MLPAGLLAPCNCSRSHELIYRVPKTNYYRINKKGQTVMMTALRFRITDLALLGLEKPC